MQMLAAVAGPEVNPVFQSLKQWIDEELAALRKDYDTFEGYYRGKHNLKLTRRLKQFLPPDMTFRDNFCKVVVNALAERLSVIGFTSEEEGLANWAQEVWQANRMDLTQVIVHTQMLMKGDSYALVDWDSQNSRPRISYQDASTVVPWYDGLTKQITMASEIWVSVPEIGANPETRLNIYYPERVEKYRLDGGVWQHFSDVGDVTWPVAWVGRDGQALGVPLIHFRNQPMGENFGVSELDDVVPLQDLLNKTLVDAVMIADTMGWRQRYVIGANNAATLKSIPGSVWNIKSDTPGDVEVGQFDTGGMSDLLLWIDKVVQHISGISRTPPHLFYVQANYPSGEALKTAESGLVHKAKLRQVNLGNSWEDVMYMARNLERAFGSQAPSEDAWLETLWADPETRNEKEHIEGLAMKREKLGVPRRQVWRELGYSEAEMDQMEKDLQAQKVADANVGAALLQQFEQGVEGQV